MTYNFDLFIIGAGPAGLAAAKQAAQYGVKVAIAEQDQLGGCCVNRGCVPKKMMIYAADYAASMQNAVDYGWEQCSSNFHWQTFRKKRDQELQRLRQVHQQALEQAGVEFLKGRTQFLDAHTLDVEGQKYTADKVLIAVGGKPIKPDIPGIEYTMNSDELLDLEQLPKRIAIIGGGYIGAEFASTLREFGCDVTVMNRESCLLEGFDEAVQVAVRNGFIQRGIQTLCSTTTDKIKQISEGLCLHLTGDCPETIVVDKVLCAIGRAPNLEGLGLEAADVEFDQKAIAVNHQNCTSQPNIYAVGDCTHRKQLTPVARTEGRRAVDAMFGKPGDELDDQLIPSSVLSRPEAASVGLTETQAREQYGDNIECHCKEFVPLRYSLTNDKEKALMKLVVERESDRILGFHMVGENAAEIVQGAAIALQKGVTRQELTQIIGVHPSTAEELFSI
ncbi:MULTISPECIES: glutathione-disulfide reductase [unclassified Leptolyngbya]|uniref:glutathione-disulfide reductase n=1 Tax=unclassified Leptolyngbya TaxID=2650499 RepID=UPI00168A0F46|nr:MULTISPECIES: glutathione-disulfide reductase [unclassified Leptolyngbya]MBD1909812.1 glutathione-disulfide reductase [Leptolyngbya sp. FACHB-8]MBD2158963.1 glutathione-disulfide reductase [Leptolyngbya sp. FACHB-16]